MKQQIITLLEDLSINYRWLDHAPVYTVADSTAVMPDKLPIKNLLLKEKSGQLHLIIMPGQQRLDMKMLATMLGTTKLSFAKPALLMELMGVEPGAVSIFGLLNDSGNQIHATLNSRLATEAEVGFHPNDNKATVFIDGTAFEPLLQALGNPYHIIDF